jgi:hypothetical protein
MNRFFRICVLNNKNFLKVITNKTVPSLTKPFNFIRPISTSKSLFDFERQSSNRGFQQHNKQRYEEDDLVDEANSEEVGQAPKSHKLDSNGYTGKTKFQDYNLPADLLARMKQLGYESPFPIQAETFPHTLAGK